MAFPDQTYLPQINPIQPGAYAAVDASAFAGTGGPTAPIPAIVATALGGVPNRAMYFRGPGALRSVLRGGVAYDMARFAFAGGASRVCVIRVGLAGSILQSTLNLTGTSGTGVTLTSIDYGTWTTAIQVTVAANNAVTISYTDAFGTTYTENYPIGTGATAAAVAAAINGQTPGFAKSNYVTAVAGAGTMPLAILAATPARSAAHRRRSPAASRSGTPCRRPGNAGAADCTPGPAASSACPQPSPPRRTGRTGSARRCC